MRKLILILTLLSLGCTSTSNQVNRKCTPSEDAALVLTDMVKCSSVEYEVNQLVRENSVCNATLSECASEYTKLKTIVLMCASGAEVVYDPKTESISVTPKQKK